MVAQTVKDLPTVQDMQLWSLGWEDPLEKGVAAYVHGVTKSQLGD